MFVYFAGIGYSVVWVGLLVWVVFKVLAGDEFCVCGLKWVCVLEWVCEV